MPTYKKLTKDGNKVQVESAIRDGNGVKIDTNYAKQDGNYQSLTSGLANNLDSKLVENDQSAYNFRPTATMGAMELEVGSPCKVKSIIGGSIGFNNVFNFTNIWSAENGTNTFDLSVPELHFVGDNNNNDKSTYKSLGQLVVGHKYFISFDYKSTHNFSLQDLSASRSLSAQANYTNFAKVEIGLNTYINSSGYASIYFYNYSNNNANIEFYIRKLMIIDLTATFGSTIADYIYSLEQSQAGVGVAWFRRYFTKPYYPYTPIGSFVNVKTKGKKVVHFNQWDEEWELGSLDSNGDNYPDVNKIRSKNFSPCLQNTV